MTGLVRRATAAVSRTGTGVAPTTPTDLGSVTWDGAVTPFEDLVPGPGPSKRTLGTGVHLDQRVRRRAGTDDYYRSGIAWLIDPDAVVVARLEQRLRPRPDGKFGTSGGWLAVEVTRHAAVGPVRRRTGTVPQGVTAPAQPGTGGAADGAPSPAMADLGYLPAVVQTGFYRAVADPVAEGAEVIRLARSDRSYYHRACAVRVGQREVVGLVAAKQGGSDSWQVEQLTFAIGDARPGSKARALRLRPDGLGRRGRPAR